MKDKCCIRCKLLINKGHKCPLAMKRVKAAQAPVAICSMGCKQFELAEELKP